MKHKSILKLSRIKHLTQAPIKEAAFGINFSKIVELHFWKDLIEELTDSFPKKTEKTAMILGINGQENKIITDGYILRSENSRITLQLLLSGIVLNFGKPYSSWIKSYQVLDNILNILIKKTDRIEAKIISVKYVNRMNFTRTEFSNIYEYLNTKPVYSGLNNEITSSYQMFIEERLEKNTTSNVISLSKVCGSDKNLIHLDTHISVLRELKGSYTSEELKEEFYDLRQIKNKIFFNSFDNEILSHYE